MKRLVWTLVISSALFVAAVPDASAHGYPYTAYDRHYTVRHRHHYPYWLSRHRDFHRWYRRSHYRHDFYLSWTNLIDIYRYERRYHRPYRMSDRYNRNRHRRIHRH